MLGFDVDGGGTVGTCFCILFLLSLRFYLSR